MKHFYVVARLEGGCRYQTKGETAPDDDDLSELRDFLGAVAAGKVAPLSLETKTGRVYIPKKLLETTVIEIVIETVPDS